MSGTRGKASVKDGGLLPAIFIFVLGLFSVIGADSYKDFYFDLKARYTGIRIEYAKLGDFCGYTGLQMPWETDLQYGLRAFWNNISAMMAMASIITVAVGTVVTVVLGILRLTGLF